MEEGLNIMGIWERSRYGWHLYDGHPVIGSVDQIRAYLEAHPPLNARDLVLRSFNLDDSIEAMPTVTIAGRLHD